MKKNCCKDGFVEVRSENGKLLFRYNPVKRLVEVKQKNSEPELVDLRKLERVQIVQGKIISRSKS